jgi:hypothetical protein
VKPTKDQVRSAKEEVKRLLQDDPNVNGIGIKSSWDRIKVKLIEDEDTFVLPQEVNGVPIEYEVIGSVSALAIKFLEEQ